MFFSVMAVSVPATTAFCVCVIFMRFSQFTLKRKKQTNNNNKKAILTDVNYILLHLLNKGKDESEQNHFHDDKVWP